MKRIILFTILAIILTAGAVFGIYVLVKNNISGNAQTYVSVSINPAVEFTVNEDGRVISSVATDAEGDQIIQSYDFYGMTIDSACEKFTQLCIDAGYVAFDNDETSVDPNEVIITVVNEDTTIKEDIANRIRTKLNTCFQNNGIFGCVSEDTLQEYIDMAATSGLPVGHIKLIMAALSYNPELSFEELAQMPINEVVKLLNNSHKKLHSTASSIRAQLKLDLEALKAEEKYTQMFTALDAIDQIIVDLSNELLTPEQVTALQTLLANARTNFEETYSTLFEEYKNEKTALIDEAKEASKQALETIKSQYRTRVQTNKQNADSARNNSASLKTRIITWQQAQENLG